MLAVFECVAEGGIMFQTHGFVSVSNLSFNAVDGLRSAADGHQATVTCTAENTEGSVSKEFVIHILGAHRRKVDITTKND